MLKLNWLKNLYLEIRVGWTKEDTLIASVSICAVALLYVLLFSSSVVKVISQTVLSPIAVGKVSKSINEKGLYRFGRMVASLGSRDEYLDADLDIEYDLGILRIQSDGEIKNLKRANKFCEDNKHKLKDAIISVFADSTIEEIKDRDGIYDLKSNMLDAINDKLSENNLLFTNIYFNKFTLMPAAG